MIKRIAEVQRQLRKLEIPAILITNLSDVKYLSGFTGTTAYMIVDLETAYFYTDSRYDVQSKEQVYEHINIEIVKDYNKIYNEYCAKYKKILLQPSCTINISSKVAASGVEIYLDENDLMQKLRMIKDEKEVKLIKEQYKLAGKAFLRALKSFKYDDSEKTWAAALEYHMKILGAKGESFETIVASGIRGAMPHGVASDKLVQSNEPVIIDFGSRDTYTSDYTRMVYNGNDSEVLHIIDIVRTAVEKSIEGISEGIMCSDIDKIAREYIQEQGYGEYFNHSLGHGVGIDVHELPVLRAKSETILEDCMIFTIEPGIYLPEKFGVRLEQTVYINNNKAEIISDTLDKYVYNIIE